AGLDDAQPVVLQRAGDDAAVLHPVLLVEHVDEALPLVEADGPVDDQKRRARLADGHPHAHEHPRRQQPSSRPRRLARKSQGGGPTAGAAAPTAAAAWAARRVWPGFGLSRRARASIVPVEEVTTLLTKSSEPWCEYPSSPSSPM